MRTVKNSNHAPTVANELSRLQYAGRLVYALTPHAKHVGHEILGQSKIIHTQAITSHQQPSGKPGVHRMKVVACNRLRYLGQQRVCVAMEETMQRT